MLRSGGDGNPCEDLEQSVGPQVAGDAAGRGGRGGAAEREPDAMLRGCVRNITAENTLAGGMPNHVSDTNANLTIKHHMDNRSESID